MSVKYQAVEATLWGPRHRHRATPRHRRRGARGRSRSAAPAPLPAPPQPAPAAARPRSQPAPAAGGTATFCDSTRNETSPLMGGCCERVRVLPEGNGGTC
jgi:hypothetical protein